MNLQCRYTNTSCLQCRSYLCLFFSIIWVGIPHRIFMICVHRIHDLNSKRQIWKITDSLAQINQHTANHLFAEKNIIRARRSALIVLVYEYITETTRSCSAFNGPQVAQHTTRGMEDGTQSKEKQGNTLLELLPPDTAMALPSRW